MKKLITVLFTIFISLAGCGRSNVEELASIQTTDIEESTSTETQGVEECTPQSTDDGITVNVTIDSNLNTAEPSLNSRVILTNEAKLQSISWNLPTISSDDDEIVQFYRETLIEHENENLFFVYTDRDTEKRYWFPLFVTDAGGQEWILATNDEGDIIKLPDSEVVAVWGSTGSKYDGIGILPAGRNYRCGDAHYPLSRYGTDVMLETQNYQIIYDNINTVVNCWHFGSISYTVEFPSDSKYCGYSEGANLYLFRDGTNLIGLQPVYDFYADDEPTDPPEFISFTISHDVKMVIACNYYVNNQFESQPLLLMSDGSVKTYCYDGIPTQYIYSQEEYDEAQFLFDIQEGKN